MPKDDKERTVPEMPAAAGGGSGGDLAGTFRLLYMVSMGLSIFLAAFGVIKFIDQLALLRQGEADTAQALVTGLGYLVGGGLSGAFVLLSVRCLGFVVTGRPMGSTGQTTLIGGSIEDVLEAVEDLRQIVVHRGGVATAAAPPERESDEAEPPERPAAEPIAIPDEGEPVPPKAGKAKPSAAAETETASPDEGERLEPATFADYRSATKQLLKEGKFYEVSKMLDSIEERFADEKGADEFVAAMRAKIDENNKTNFDGLCRKVEGLVQKGQWLDAILMAEEVERKFPDREEVKDFALSIRRRRADSAAGESRDQYRRVLRLVAEKDWEKAYTQAEEFLAMYPEDEKVPEIRQMLDKIKSKLQRKQVAILSEYIKDAIDKKNYALAYKASLRLIQKFPDSKEARNVKAGLDNLKRLAGLEQ